MEKNNVKFTGIMTALVSCLDENENVNVASTEKVVNWHLSEGYTGFYLTGSTGEGPTLRDEELRDLITIAKEHVRPEQPIVCGIMRTCTRDAVRAGLVAKEAGADYAGGMDNNRERQSDTC